MACKCGSTRIMHVFAKHNDMVGLNIDHLGIEYHDGYMPYLGPLGGDDMNLDICMDCGTIQGWKKITDEDVMSCEALEDAIEEQAERARRKKEIADGSHEKPITLAGLRGPKLDNGQIVSWPTI